MTRKRRNQELPEGYIEVKVVGSGFVDESGVEGFIVLESSEGKNFTMRAFSGEVALHIARALEGDKSSIPTIYNMIEDLASTLEYRLIHVKVYPSGNVLRANLYFKGRNNKEFVLRHYRASDAIALAVYCDASIYIREELLK